MLYRNEDSLVRLYHKWYSRTYSELRLPLVFEELEKQGILKKVGGNGSTYWFGTDTVWNRLEPKIPEIPQVIEARRG